MQMDGKKFLVIGGAGLIGSHTVDYLIKEDVNEVIIYDNMTRGSTENLNKALKDPRVKVYEVGGDILQTDILNNAIKNIDGVFHFAALWLLQCHEYPRSAFNVNIQGTFNVMDACVKENVKKLIYSSSASVYGDAIKNPMEEDHPFNNKNFYGATKICGEALLRAYHHRYKLDYLGLRYMNVFGPRQDYKGAYIAVIMKMLDSIENNQNPVIFGDGSESFDFVSVKDCALANICAMKSNLSNQFYNVGTGTKTSLKELAQLLLKLTKSDLSINYVPRENSTLVKNRIGSVHKAKKEIQFEAKIDLEEGLKDLIDWKKSNKANFNE